MKKLCLRAVAFLMLGAVLCCGIHGSSVAESYYVENEWNFVDGSMDVNHGIPENATGVLDRIKRKGVLKVRTSRARASTPGRTWNWRA